jgi:CDP-diacylglycerol---serine O-phosphatidyltransferase
MKSQFPNIVTACNLICGCIATVFALCFDARTALLFIILGAVFDFGDGLSARALKVSSPIGKELDSLADVITFGLAPSAIIFSELLVLDYPAFMASVKDYVPYLAFVMAAFSASRLAKFNLDERQTTSFIGLPTPANALFWGSLISSYHLTIENTPNMVLLIIPMIFVSCWLLVCEMPMFALKFKHWGFNDANNRVKYCFLLFSLIVFVCFLIDGKPEGSLTFIILAYILVSFVMWRLKSRRKAL